MSVGLPHKLGAEEAKRRIAANLGGLAGHLPANARVSSAWQGDRLSLDVGVLGQSIEAAIDVRETLVRITVLLPPALAFFGQAIELASGRAPPSRDVAARKAATLRHGLGRVSRQAGESCSPYCRSATEEQSRGIETQVEMKKKSPSPRGCRGIECAERRCGGDPVAPAAPDEYRRGSAAAASRVGFARAHWSRRVI